MTTLKLHSAAGRWVVAGSVLGSGAVFLESSVVNVALPAIARDFHVGVVGLQWVINGYLLTLSALMLLGGALGDRFGRPRVFAIGCVAFALASAGCALAPELVSLVALRVVQGAAGALLVPNSLAMLDTAFAGEERGAAIGQWAAWSAVSTAAGPFAGGWLVDALNWRWVFSAVILFALVAALIVVRHIASGKVKSAAGRDARERIDYLGAALGTLALAGIVGALMSGPAIGFRDWRVLAAGAGGVVCMVAFIFAERRARTPILPLSIFRSQQFSGVNATTFLVYAALSGLFFLLMPQLQGNLKYSALRAGAALTPANVIMLVFSPIAGRASARVGPRVLMTTGALIAAIGMVLFARVQPGASYVKTILPAIVIFGIGLSVLVAPLTSAVLSAVKESDTGIASGINNAIARLAGLIATAALPLAAGIGGSAKLEGAAFAAGYGRAMLICAGLCATGALVALITVRSDDRTMRASRGKAAASRKS
ncbi:MAG TPA: DHA2 family efflux MFS transporter permease subunit [Gemmatimonadaceae bacterium]|nr:DHA2 family efflux MFS transporter permease subunit [Gemmatimonadaceae bacterium]